MAELGVRADLLSPLALASGLEKTRPVRLSIADPPRLEAVGKVVPEMVAVPAGHEAPEGDMKLSNDGGKDVSR